MSIHAPISQLCPLKGPTKRKQKNPVARSTSSVQILTSNAKLHWKKKKKKVNPELLKEAADSRAGVYTMSLEHPVIPESRKLLKH